jgi:hypothetical protein
VVVAIVKLTHTAGEKLNKYMAFLYKHKKTGKVVKTKTPMKGKDKSDYILVGWIRNMIMKAQDIIKK